MRWCLLVFFFVVARAAAEERFVFEKAEMGVQFRVTLFAMNEAEAKAAADAAFARVAALNAVMSDYDPDSELSRLSQTSGRAVRVSDNLWRVLAHAQALAEKTDGAFDVTVGPLVTTWRRARRKRELPAPELIAEMRARVGWRALQLDPAAKTATLAQADMRLDLGAIAKGFAVDEALALLKKRGFPRALVAGAGDMAAGDAPPGAEGWKIEVAAHDGDAAAAPAQVVVLQNRAIATSGDVFQHVEIAGVRYSHIVDPRTGLGLTDRSLVTVLAPTCMTSDALATAASVAGPERGLRLIEETPEAAGRFVRKPGAAIEVRASSRWPAP